MRLSQEMIDKSLLAQSRGNLAKAPQKCPLSGG